MRKATKNLEVSGPIERWLGTSVLPKPIASGFVLLQRRRQGITGSLKGLNLIGMSTAYTDSREKGRKVLDELAPGHLLVVAQ